jgi:thioredoxin-like negative regulator of GroEL
MSKPIEEVVLGAKELANEKRFMESASAFSEIFKEDPCNPGALRELAGVMSELGQMEMALALLADSVDFESPDIQTLHQISLLLRGQNRNEEAADFLLCACAYDPSNAGLIEETRVLLRELGREQELQLEEGGSGSESASAG